MTPISTPPEINALFAMVTDDSRPALERLLVGASLRDGLDHLLTELAQAAREEEGHSWAQVGSTLDISKQAAQQRFGKVDAIRVDIDGCLTTTEVREEHVEAMREALAKLQAGHEALASGLDEVAQSRESAAAGLDDLARRMEAGEDVRGPGSRTDH